LRIFYNSLIYIGYISKISDIFDFFDIFDIFENIAIFSIPACGSKKHQSNLFNQTTSNAHICQ